MVIIINMVRQIKQSSEANSSTKLNPDEPSNYLFYLSDVLPLTQTLGDDGVQHVLVTGSEAMSGEWVRDVVKTGVDSWRPVHLLLMCSVTCIVSALTLVNCK